MKPESVYIYDKEARQILGRRISAFIKKEKFAPVLMCIGSDRVTGDCLGPLVGHLLVTKHNVKTYVYGTLELPLTALNLKETLEFVNGAHPGVKIIAVDASLGNPDDIGAVRVQKGGIYPGAAVDKALPRVGDVSVTAVVGGNDFAGSRRLAAARLAFILRLAEAIAGGIADAFVRLAAAA